MLCDLLHETSCSKRVLGERATADPRARGRDQRTKVRRVALTKVSGRHHEDVGPWRDQAEEDAGPQKKQTEVVKHREEGARLRGLAPAGKEAAEATSPERTARGNSIVIGGHHGAGCGHKKHRVCRHQANSRRRAALRGRASVWACTRGASGRREVRTGHPETAIRGATRRGRPSCNLASTPVLTTACGYSHMACVTTSRDLYVRGRPPPESWALA